MARLQWNQEINKKYALGLDRGVLYPENASAIPWNGLRQVTEIPIREPMESYYFDGVKYFDRSNPASYQMQVTAVTFPDIFEEGLGQKALIPGFYLTKQEKRKFNFSYRTQLGEDLGYQIHLVYNAIATQTEQLQKTLTAMVDLPEQSWIIETIPLTYEGRRPTSYIVFNSIDTNPTVLLYLESLLYGTDESDPRLPTMFELFNIFEYWKPVQVAYDPSGLFLLLPQFGDLFRTRIEGLFLYNPFERLKLTSTSGIYRLES